MAGEKSTEVPSRDHRDEVSLRDIGVSKNRGGPPKWMIYNGKPY